MHTCYSPVRQSPAGGASSSPAALRLACVKPAASVHPEPGSNSPLLVIYCYISFFQIVCLARIQSLFRIDGTSFLCPCTLKQLSLLVLVALCQCSLCFGFPLSRVALGASLSALSFPICDCKISAKSSAVQVLFKKSCRIWVIFVVNYYGIVQSRNVKISFILLRLFERWD